LIYHKSFVALMLSISIPVYKAQLFVRLLNFLFMPVGTFTHLRKELTMFFTSGNDHAILKGTDLLLINSKLFGYGCRSWLPCLCEQGRQLLQIR